MCAYIHTYIRASPRTLRQLQPASPTQDLSPFWPSLWPRFYFSRGGAPQSQRAPPRSPAPETWKILVISRDVPIMHCCPLLSRRRISNSGSDLTLLMLYKQFTVIVGASFVKQPLPF